MKIMIAAGIVDPTKVTRSALENAASVAEMVLTTESLVADLPEPPLLPQPVVTWAAWAACTKPHRLPYQFNTPQKAELPTREALPSFLLTPFPNKSTLRKIVFGKRKHQ